VLSDPESNQSGDQILEIGDDEWMSVVNGQDTIHELGAIGKQASI
jgi:hypothetical protein